MRRQDPEAVVLAAVRLHARALGHVPHADGLVQKRSCSRRYVCTPVRLDMSHTRTDLSSELETMMSCRAWNMTQLTLFRWPRSVSTSHGYVSFMRHSLTWRSSAPDTISGSVGWNAAQLTPRSCPSSTYLTTASPPPKRSEFICCP